MKHTRVRQGALRPGSLLAPALAIVIALGVAAPGTVAAADSSSNIPGVPLPGPVAAGRLGGAIYDVVYRFSVSPGYVIVASLSGTAATDFDLYLFDSSATSVLSTQGLLLKSNGPTSTESISSPSRLGGTYYLDLNGASDIEGDFLLTVQTVPDSTPPTVSLKLAGGRAMTNELTVPVTLSAQDDLSGIAEMAFSEDGTTFAAWEPFLASSTWTFEPGDGPKRLWVKVRNGVGLASASASAPITIDTVPPSLAGIDPQPGAIVVGLQPTISIAFNEPIDPASWLDLGLIVQSSSGALIPGVHTYDAPSQTGSFTPSVPLHAGALYLVTVGNVTDVAGNGVASPGSWTVTPLSPSALSAAVDAKVLKLGGSARITVTLSGVPLPAEIGVEASTGSDPFVARPTIATDDGHNLLVIAPTSNTTYRFRYTGTATVGPALAEARILVRRSVAIVGRAPDVTSRAKVGGSVKLTLAVGPTAGGVPVSFRLYRFDTARRAWVYAGSHGRNTDASGRATFTWTPSAPGSWYWRATVSSNADFANNTSAVYRWSVTR